MALQLHYTENASFMQQLFPNDDVEISLLLTVMIEVKVIPFVSSSDPSQKTN